MKRFLFVLMAMVCTSAFAADFVSQTVDQFEMEYYPDDGQSWFITLYCFADHRSFNFDVKDPRGQGLKDGVTYKWSAMIPETCYAQDGVIGAEMWYRDADFTLTYDENNQVKTIVAHAWYAEQDSAFEITYEAPVILEAKDTMDIVFPDSRYEDYTLESNQLRVSGWDADQRWNLYIMLQTSRIAGTYTWADIQSKYTSLFYYTPAEETPDGEGGMDQTRFVNGEVKIANVEGGLHVEAYLITRDEHCYHADMFCPIPEKQSEASIEADNLVMNAAWLDVEGFCYFMAKDDDYQVYLAVVPHQGEGIYGTGYTHKDLDLQYSLLKDLRTGKMIEIYHASLSIVEYGVAGYELNAKLLCFDGVEYTLHLVGDGILEYDNVDEGFTADYSGDELYLLTDWTADFDRIGLMGIRPSWHSIYLEFNVDYKKDMKPLVDATGVYRIPAGTYPINDTGRQGTVSSSTGVGNEGPEPSYACGIDNQMNIDADHMWFLVGGTVVVSYDAQDNMLVTVDAVNSVGLPIRVTLSDLPMAVPAVKGGKKASKRLVGSELIIENNGLKYNVLGIKL